MFLRVRAFPALRIPNFKTTAPPDECHLAFDLEHFAKLIREEETTLLVRGAVLSAGMELSQIDAQVPRGDTGCVFSGSADPGKFLGRHDEEELATRFRDDEEFLGLAGAPPARGNCDPMFVIELMNKFSRIKIER